MRSNIVSICQTAGSGVTTDIWTSYSAMIMVLSVILLMVLQFAQILPSSSGRQLAVLISLVVLVSLLIVYFVYLVNIEVLILQCITVV